MTPAELLAAHLAVQHGCCYIVGRPDGSGFDQCGLWCGHTGQCVSFTPGWYLVERELHPLDVLRLRFMMRRPWRACCPVCGARSGSAMVSAIGLVSWDVGEERRLAHETRWDFWPCGCAARELVG